MLNSRKKNQYDWGRFFLWRGKVNIRQDMNKALLIELQLRFLIDNHRDHLQRIDEVLQGYFLLT
jgi:hypothetical protein